MPRFVIEGVVQGVGFRPFVYRLAKRYGLKGYVKNLGDSVEICINRNKPGFWEGLKAEKPPLAAIATIREVEGEEEDYDAFQILESSSGSSQGSSLPPDLALCQNCERELFNPADRRYLYPFTVCTDCGPRFSIIERLPYDRANTSMAEFELCGLCSKEYTSPESRRFKAEPTACPKCGPLYRLYRGKKEVETDNPVRETAYQLEKGKILAVKGVGGVHLACLATDNGAVGKLRRRVGREHKPLAIMARDLGTARRIALIDREEKKLLAGIRRPILVLKKRGSEISENVSPGLHTIGIMLAYSGLHHILFHHMTEPALIMTSCNPPGEPMAIENNRVLNLGYHDYALLHDRRIVNRVDDSVVRMVRGRRAFIRRSRGYVPPPVELKRGGITVLALGAEENVAPCLLSGGRAYTAQYIGRTSSPENLVFLKSSADRIMELTGVDEIDAIASDLHPEFQTTKLAGEMAEMLGSGSAQIQHHEAHIASVAAEKGLERGIGIALDGFGYGSDGKAWGGEVFYFVEENYQRVGSIGSFPLIGGDAAVKRPLRIAAGLLLEEGKDKGLKAIHELGMSRREAEVVVRQWERNLNVFSCSSMGRTLDAISAMLGVCAGRTYEGEPAMKLESLAAEGEAKLEMPVEMGREEGMEVLQASRIAKACWDYLKAGESKKNIASSAQSALAVGMARIALGKAGEHGVDTVALSGGVAYNEAIVGAIEEFLSARGVELCTNEKVAPGDNGLSLGQGYLARQRMEER